MNSGAKRSGFCISTREHDATAGDLSLKCHSYGLLSVLAS